MPKVLGTLKVEGLSRATFRVGTISGSCDREVTAARLKITLEPSAEAKPGLPLMAFKTYVDGQWYVPWNTLGAIPNPWHSWKGRGEDMLFSTCVVTDKGVTGQLTQGEHRVRMVGTMPGWTWCVFAGSRRSATIWTPVVSGSLLGHWRPR